MDFIFRAAEKFLKDHKRLMRYRKVFAVLAAVVVFATTYELILPAITIDRQRAAETPGMEVGVAAEEVVEESETEGSGADEEDAEAAEEESRTEAEQTLENEDIDNSDASEESADSENVENTDDGDADQANADNGADAAVDENAEYNADSKETTESSANAEADTSAAATEEAATTATTEAPAVEYPVTLTYEGEDYTVTATFDETAALPAGVSLDALEILPDMVYRDEDGNVLYDDYEVYLKKTVDTLEKDGRLEDSYVASVRFFDISFIDPEGNYVEPAAPVIIATQYKKALSAEDTVSTTAVRFEAGKDKTEIYETKQDVKNGAIAEISFETKKTSVYGIAAAEALETKELTASGDTYEISLSYNQKAEIPEDAKLQAHELLPGTEEYEACAAKSANTDENGETTSRFFDISIMADGAEYEPKAPVNVKITLKDTAPEKVAADKEITHFTNNGQVENIPQEVEESSDGGAEVSFQMDSFSTVEVPLLGAGNSYSVEVGASITINGSSSKSHSWSSSNSDVATVSGSGATGTVTGVNAGTATITHTLKKGSETFTVTVTDPYVVDNTEGNLTVTVKENGNSKKLSDYTLVVEQIVSTDPYYDEYENQILTDTGETTLNFLDMYHIYLQDQNGKEVDLENQNVNLKVTMTFKETPAGWPSENKLKVGHYSFKKNASETISGKDVNNVTVRGDSVSFMIKSFSTITLSAGSTSTTGGGGSVTTREGSILDGFSYDDANEWQVVAEGYTNNTAENKTSYGNDSFGFVRVQKNVIPTGTENEFYVYLSIDTKDLLREWLKYGTYNKASQNNWGEQNGYKIGDIVPSMPSHKSKFTADPNAGLDWYTNVDVVDDAGNVILENLPIYSDQSQNNATVFLKIDDTHWVLFGVTVQKTKTTSGRSQCKLGAEAMQMIQEVLGNVLSLNSVTDTMGDNIEFLGVVDGDYETEPTCTDGVLHWTPVMKTNPESVTTASGNNQFTTWSMNVSELVYKVRLDVTDPDFKSCANNMNSGINDSESNPVNENAVLNYDISLNGTTQTGKEAVFQKPYVRGLLYDMKIKKVDQDGQPLEGAKFSLTGTSANTNADIAQQAAAEVPQAQLISGTDGWITIPGLPWGTYTLTETEPPKGYRIDDNYKNGRQYMLCWTQAPSLLADNNTHKILKEGNNSYLTVTNKKNKITFTKQVGVANDLTLQEVDHTIYIALWHGGENGDYLRDDNGDIICQEITITDGTPSPATVTFEGIDTDFYDVYELSTVNGSTCTELGVGHDILVNSEGREFQLIRIEGINDADLTASNEAAVTQKNIYSDPVRIPFDANKKWGSPDGNELTAAPTGTTVTFALFRRQKAASGQADNPWSPVIKDNEQLTVTLDGTVDENGESKSWRATFEDLPVKDENDSSILYEYAVKEITCSSEDFQLYDKSIGSIVTDPDQYYMKSNGGYIWNVQKAVSITIKKVNNADTFLPGAKFKLFRIETDSQGETHDNQVGEEFTFSNADSAGITIDGLPSGLYKLTETAAPAGYIITDRDITFTVNAKGSGSVITWSKGGKPDNAKDLSQTNNTDDTITVINTPGVELPETGGTGFLSPQTLCGIMAMAFVLATAVMYGFSMRRGERRYK